jgi:hypothetical protein
MNRSFQFRAVAAGFARRGLLFCGGQYKKGILQKNILQYPLKSRLWADARAPFGAQTGVPRLKIVPKISGTGRNDDEGIPRFYTRRFRGTS